MRLVQWSLIFSEGIALGSFSIGSPACSITDLLSDFVWPWFLVLGEFGQVSFWVLSFRVIAAMHLLALF